MRKSIIFFAAAGLAISLIAPTALADWPHEVKWDQLQPDSLWAAWSYVSPTYETIAADDFPCTETGWITDIEFDEHESAYQPTSFRISFWTDVPETPNEESHPGDLIVELPVDPADPNDPLGLGWKKIGIHRYKINLPRDMWFEQEEGNIYWISIQGVLSEGWWAWRDRDRYEETWGDDAAYSETDLDGWWHLGWIDEETGGEYQGTLPDDWWKSTDLSFKLTGTPIPEPGAFTLGLACVALSVLRLRKK
jgi:hypothetical protein